MANCDLKTLLHTANSAAVADLQRYPSSKHGLRCLIQGAVAIGMAVL